MRQLRLFEDMGKWGGGPRQGSATSRVGNSAYREVTNYAKSEKSKTQSQK
jgi:hypothetical protein